MKTVIETNFGDVTIQDILMDLDNLENSPFVEGISLSFGGEVFAKVSGQSTTNFGNSKEDIELLEQLIKEVL